MNKPLSLLLAFALTYSAVPHSASAEESVMQQLKKAVSGSEPKKEGKKTAKKEAKSGSTAGAPAPTVRPAPADGSPDAVQFNVRFNDVEETVIIQLRPDLAPKTVEAFKRNVQEGFYNGLAFHRALRGFLVQAGDPTTKSDSNKELWGTSDIGTTIPLEASGQHIRGAVAMAHRPDQTDSSGSQFYILLKNSPNLNGQYTVFGQVIRGLDTINRVSGTVVDNNDVPLRRVEITDAKLTRSDSPAVKAAASKGGVKKTKPESEKGFIDKVMERIW